MPRSRYRILNKTYPHFLTATVNRWQPLFTRTETVEIVLDSWRFLQRGAEFEIYGYVILENHLHLIASSPDLSRDMQRFKSYTAKRIIDYLEQIQAKRVLELLALFKRAHKTESQYQVCLVSKLELGNQGINRSSRGLTYCGFRIFPGTVRLTNRKQKRYRLLRRRYETAWERNDMTDRELQSAYDAILAATLPAESQSWRQRDLQLHPSVYENGAG